MKPTEYNVLPFRADSAGRTRKIVYTPKKIVVELEDGTDVTGSLSREELKDVVDAVRIARNRKFEDAAEKFEGDAVEAATMKDSVVVVTEAMVDACYDDPKRVPLPGKNLMRKTLERALKAAKLHVVDLPYLHLHARLAGDYLMKARDLLGHKWNGALDEALNHIDYVRTALDPYVDDKLAEPQPDYKKLFADAMYHLRVVSGSRNSFTSDATDRLFDMDQPSINVRTPHVETMQREAATWLKQHEYLIPQDQATDEPKKD